MVFAQALMIDAQALTKFDLSTVGLKVGLYVGLHVGLYMAMYAAIYGHTSIISENCVPYNVPLSILPNQPSTSHSAANLPLDTISKGSAACGRRPFKSAAQGLEP